ncbi:MAG: hypothetical protein R2865_15685 [Deinococcales bacterium]
MKKTYRPFNAIMVLAVILMACDGTLDQGGNPNQQGVGNAFGSQVISSYQAAFQSPSPANGWRYLWNAYGPLGDLASYASLYWNQGDRYDSDGAVGSPDNSQLLWGNLAAKGGHPGKTPSADNSFERYVIAAYRISATGVYLLKESIIQSIAPCTGSDGGHVVIYANQRHIHTVNYGAGASTSFDISLGQLSPNDEIFIAVGGNNNDSCDSFEWDFKIARYLDDNPEYRLSNYRNHFSTSAWRYLWNAGGPIGQESAYQSLYWNGSAYDSNGLVGIPDGSKMSWGHLSSTGGHVGAGTAQGQLYDRYAIAAYRVSEVVVIALESYIHHLSGTCPNPNGLKPQSCHNDRLVGNVLVAASSQQSFDYDLSSLWMGMIFISL